MEAFIWKVNKARLSRIDVDVEDLDHVRDVVDAGGARLLLVVSPEVSERMQKPANGVPAAPADDGATALVHS